MRLAISLLVVLTAVTLVSCGGSDDETASPLPFTQRFVTAAGCSRFEARSRREARDDDGLRHLHLGAQRLLDRPRQGRDDDSSSMMPPSRARAQDARFFGETHSPETSVHVFSSFIEVGSEDGATSALDWLETDQMKPCPMSCAVQRSSFKVDDIPDARGVHRVATAEDIERVGTQRRADHKTTTGSASPTVRSSTRWFCTATRCQEPFPRTKLSRSRRPITTVSQPASGPR